MNVPRRPQIDEILCYGISEPLGVVHGVASKGPIQIRAQKRIFGQNICSGYSATVCNC
jgi:hypothetical protein